MTYDLIADIYSKYDSIHASLEEAAQLGSLIIDCHSFPADLDHGIDICIGFNEDASRPDDDILNLVAEHFTNAGLKVGINAPYSNSMRVEKDIPTLMIEVNKRVYLQNDGKTPSGEFDKIKRLISSLYTRLFIDSFDII